MKKKLTLEILHREAEWMKRLPNDGWYRLPCLPKTQKEVNRLKRMGIKYEGPIDPEQTSV